MISVSEWNKQNIQQVHGRCSAARRMSIADRCIRLQWVSECASASGGAERWVCECGTLKRSIIYIILISAVCVYHWLPVLDVAREPYLFPYVVGETMNEREERVCLFLSYEYVFNVLTCHLSIQYQVSMNTNEYVCRRCERSCRDHLSVVIDTVVDWLIDDWRCCCSLSWYHLRTNHYCMSS